MSSTSSNIESGGTTNIVIHSPDSTNKVFQPSIFPYDRLMTSWAVAASTLPLWKSRKNVTITYDPIEGTPCSESFLDVVEFNNVKSPVGKPPSKIVGVDKLEKNPHGAESPDAEVNGVKFMWRGKGFLAISTSHWQILGYSLSDDPGRKQEDWIVTYFGSTMFTPAGLDIYVREPKVWDEVKIRKLVQACQQNEDPTVQGVARDFFVVPRD